jgi:hypothetical protein
MQLINETLGGLEIGQPVGYQNLTLFPLLSDVAIERNYLTLREAISSGDTVIREVSESGSVPELLIENNAKKPVLILDGEELIGAKQNRTANVTILAAAMKSTVIPVSCVEAGRWSYDSPEFTDSDRAHFSRGRRLKMGSVTQSMRDYGARDANQEQVWEEIDNKAMHMNVDSDTGAMADIYEKHEHSLENYVKAMTSVERQVGALFAIGESIEGLDLFDCPMTLTDMLSKLTRSYAIDAMDTPTTLNPGSKPSTLVARGFLERLTRADAEAYPAVGLGTEIRLSAQQVIGAGLVEEQRVVHLAAFSAPAQTQRPGMDEDDNYDRATTRRQRMMRR